ncbi:MAG TPA: hypothetical protein VGM21_20660 [Actinomycetota bacterium]|jgi:hypothetical protein
MSTPVPWIALAALVAMFVLPWLDAHGLLDGSHTVRHRPHRHVCADCAEPWQPGHACTGWQAAAGREPVVLLDAAEPPAPAPVRAQLTPADKPGRLALPHRERRS